MPATYTFIMAFDSDSTLMYEFTIEDKKEQGRVATLEDISNVFQYFLMLSEQQQRKRSTITGD